MTVKPASITIECAVLLSSEFLSENVVCVRRTKQNLDLNDEMARSKRLLDEKYFEAGRLREEAVSKGD